MLSGSLEAYCHPAKAPFQCFAGLVSPNQQLFFRVFLVLTCLLLLILFPAAENPVIWSWCSCQDTDISMTGYRQPGKKITGSMLAKCHFYWQVITPSFFTDAEKIAKLLMYARAICLQPLHRDSPGSTEGRSAHSQPHFTWSPTTTHVVDI